MGKIVDNMLRSAGMMIYNLFTRWKLDTFNDIERRRAMQKNRKLNAMWDVLELKYRQHLKAGFSGTAGDAMNTNSRQRILTRLGNSTFGRMKAAWDSWKYDTFAKAKAEMERKKANVIDIFVRNAMSPL